MKSGLYRVETKDFVAGFVVTSGGLGPVAPILRKNILFWCKLAKRVGDIQEMNHETDPQRTLLEKR